MVNMLSSLPFVLALLVRWAEAQESITVNFDISQPLIACEDTTIDFSIGFTGSTGPAANGPGDGGPNPPSITIYVTSASDITNAQAVLSETTSVSDDSIPWNPVNVPPGHYIIFAMGTGINTDFQITGSEDFTVVAGTSSACYSTNAGSTSANPSASSPSPSVNPVSPTGLSTAPAPSISETLTTSPSSASSGIAITGATSSNTSHISTGLKAGLGVLGALVVIAGLTALYWLFVGRRRKTQTFPASAPYVSNSSGGAAGAGAQKRSRAWEGLNSVDEYATGAGSFGAGAYAHSPTKEGKSYPDGLGRSFSASGQSRGMAVSPTASTTEYDEKYSPSTSSPIDGMSYPPQDPHMSGMAYLPPANLHDHPSPRSPIYTSPAVMMRTSSMSSTGSRVQTRNSSTDFPYPIAGVNGVPLPDPARRSKGGTARKPVPSYTATESQPSMDDSMINRHSYIDPFAGSGNSRPESTTDLHMQASSLESSSGLHAPSGSGRGQELHHQSSFEKPMQHVLIPDMPPARVSSPPIGLR